MRSSVLQLRRRFGFSLVEVLLAIGILGVGLVMVATVFPVGAVWTKKSVDDSVAQTVAQDAFAILQAHYPFGSAAANNAATAVKAASPKLIVFPGISTNIPINSGSTAPSERCYKFGASPPFPGDPTTANFFWTALARTSTTANPGNAGTRSFDVYILVFRKGAVAQQYSTTPAGFTPLAAFSGDASLPLLAYGPYPDNSLISYDKSSGRFIFTTGEPVIPAIGEYGIGMNSGTVFRQQAYVDNQPNASDDPAKANPSFGQILGVCAYPPLMGSPAVAGAASSSPGTPPTVTEPVIIAPPADGTSNSPLIYVYQTSWNY